jgi:hypothetical protein
MLVRESAVSPQELGPGGVKQIQNPVVQKKEVNSQKC